MSTVQLMTVRFLTQDDLDCIEKVQTAAQNGAVTIVDYPHLLLFVDLRNKARSTDTSVSSFPTK